MRPSFTEHLEHHAAHQPNEVAIHFQGEDITWKELDERASRNGAGQRALGIKAGGRVAYYGKNNPACLETVYGSGRAGTVCAIVNWRLAPAEVAYSLNDAEAELVFVSTEFAPVVEEIRAQLPHLKHVVVVGAGAYREWLASHPPAEPGPVEMSAGWAQLYTSGTTGFPKGAVLTFEGLATHSEGCAAELLAVKDGTVPVNMVAMPLFHVGGLCWFMAGAWFGYKTVLVEEIHPVHLLNDITAHQVTHSFFVPAVFAFFLQVPDLAQRNLSSLQILVYGASPMPLPVLEKSLEIFQCDFWQVYGMTEMSGVVTALDPESHRDPNTRHRLLAAGKVIPTCELKVVDPASGEELPANSRGEVMVRSKQRMAGYYNRPEATEEAFRQGWLRSGDAGHFDDDGYLYITDRVKDMIVSGGENIYPAEIERVLERHPAVTEVSVIGVPHDTFGEEVKAVIVPAEEVTDEALIEYCREQLAGYKVPRSIDRIDALPRGATGKVLKRELRAPYWEGRERQVV